MNLTLLSTVAYMLRIQSLYLQIGYHIQIKWQYWSELIYLPTTSLYTLSHTEEDNDPIPPKKKSSPSLVIFNDNTND